MSERHDTWLTALTRGQQFYEREFGPIDGSCLVVPSSLKFVARDFVEGLPEKIDYLSLHNQFAFFPGPFRAVVWDEYTLEPRIVVMAERKAAKEEKERVKR